MKYIRTKDGRIFQVRKGFEGKEWENSDEYFYKHYHSRADTIEELCDYFAFEDAFESKWFSPILFTSHISAKLEYKKQKRPVIGYIVVERYGVNTLEPVTKTNDEGEFVLL